MTGEDVTMQRDAMNVRLEEVAAQLLQEFGPKLGPDVVQRQMDEFLQRYGDSRVPDFVPLFMSRYVRERLLALTAAPAAP